LRTTAGPLPVTRTENNRSFLRGPLSVH